MLESTRLAITAELEKARSKFPGTRHCMNALTEEVGELAQALLEQEYKPEQDFNSEVRKEAIQVAAMAIRILEEGDTTFPNYLPVMGEQHADD
jgi:NTP pyrophosphatase (non-canonical NTP hydrolase)